jgi:hypothetical protein
MQLFSASPGKLHSIIFYAHIILLRFTIHAKKEKTFSLKIQLIAGAAPAILAVWYSKAHLAAELLYILFASRCYIILYHLIGCFKGTGELHFRPLIFFVSQSHMDPVNLP